MQNSLPTTNSNTHNDFNIKEQIFHYLQYWKWFVVSVLLCLSLAFLYLRYNVIEYGIASSILIKDEKKGGTSEFSAFSDLNIFSAKNNVDNEIVILKSRMLSQNVIKNLDLDISYFSEGRVVSRELYKEDSPINIVFINKVKSYYEKDTTLVVSIKSNNQFVLSNSLKTSNETYTFGQKIQSGLGEFIIKLNSNSNRIKFGDEVFIVKSRLEEKSNSFRNKVGISSIEKTNVINLTSSDRIEKRGIDYLNALVDQYNYDAVKDRNQVAQTTKEFITNRLDIITKELGGVEGQAEQFKKDRRLTNLEADSNLSLGESVDYNKSVLQLETDMKLSQFMIDEINTAKSDELLPTNIISSSESSGSYITQYNQLLLQKRRLLKGATELNPETEKINNELISLKLNIVESLKNKQKDLLTNKNDLLRQRSIYDGKVYQVPTNERYYNEIARQQQIKESLYLYLLQKREETEISMAVTSPKAKIIDYAYSNGPISLNRNIFFIVAILLGLLFPGLIIFLIQFFDTKIKNRQDIEGKVSIPFLGDLPRSKTNEEIIKSNSRSSSAEAIRMIRTNLEFMLAHVPENKCKTIFVTSSIPKEGKTFCAINLATTIALSEKKVLLIGLDVRNPKLDQYISLPSKGLTNYLSKPNDSISDYIVKVKDFNNFFALPSGVIPPNPVELLMNDKLNTMFSELKKDFDYIVVDTAPISVVTDTLLIAKNADSFVYVMRANYVDKRMLKFAESLYKENKLPNMSILLNDTEQKKIYGYGYGYGYGNDNEESDGFMEKLKSIFKLKK